MSNNNNNNNDNYEQQYVMRLRPLVHEPTEEELAAVIYQCRWVDGIKKDIAMATDAEIAKAILKLLRRK